MAVMGLGLNTRTQNPEGILTAIQMHSSMTDPGNTRDVRPLK